MSRSMTSPPTVGTNARDAAEHRARARGVDIVRELKDGHDVTRNVARWDRYIAGREAKEGGSFGTALDVHGQSPSWAAFARETFAKLYDSGQGADLDPEKRPDGSDWVAKLHESAEALPEWRALRERARRDPWACGVASGEALRVLSQTVKPPETDPEAIKNEIDFVKSLMVDESGKQRTTPKHLQRLAALQRQLKDSQAEHAVANQTLANQTAAVRSALRGAAQKAQAEIDEMDSAMSTLGAGDGSGIMSRVAMPPAALREALRKDDKLRRVIRLAGRMKASAIQKQRSKARPGREELCDVTPGDDITRLIPSELINLATPETEALLFARLCERSALTYELRGRERKAEGPIIMVVDESGSMSGTPDEWAKAVAFALMEIAARQNRGFAYVHFDSNVTQVHEVPEPKKMTFEQIADLVQYFTGGGTRIGVALAHAAGMLEDALKLRGDHPWKRADVVLVTDGCSGDTHDQSLAIKRIKDVGGHLYSIFIGHTSAEPCALEADEKIQIGHQVIQAGDPSKIDKVFEL